VTRRPHRSHLILGDLFAIFPDLPWPRASTMTVSAAMRRATLAERVRATRVRAAQARARFSAAIARYAAEVEQRRANLKTRRRL
jgi:hypothetical protein